MDFDDQDWVQGPAAEQDEARPSCTWKVAVGVAIGIVVGATAMYVAQHPATALARHDAARALERAITGTDATPASGATPARPPAVAPDGTPAGRDGAQAPAASAPPPRPAPASAVTQALLGRPAAASVPRSSAQEQHERRERAWARYYRKPPHCDDSPTADAMIDCANHYIRSRRQFDEAYAAGKL
jgi:hypothetical protein